MTCFGSQTALCDPKELDAPEDKDRKRWTAARTIRMLGPMWTALNWRGLKSSASKTRLLATQTPARQLPVRRLAALLTVMTAVTGGERAAAAQACTTQAKATAEQRMSTGAVAYRLASAVQRADVAAVKSDTSAQLTGDFGATANLIQATSAGLAGDSLAVKQLYLLDASTRSATDTADADFTCALGSTAAETDFSIAGLPAGRYAFLIVAATGPQPWTLSFLLQAEGTGWKMAGFYPHRTDVAGHDGLWYWTAARADAKAGKPWLAYVRYGEADQLLRPANFVATTNLFRLRSELRSATPPALADGLSETNPLVLTGLNGAEYRITGLNSDSSSDGKQLNLLVHLRGEGGNDAQAAVVRGAAAGEALLRAHPELRTGFDNLWVISETPGTNPVISDRPIAEVAGAK